MKTRKVPLRTCVVTKERYHKKDLIRVVRNKEGEVFIDKTESGKENGKGCYLKRDMSVINIAKQNKILDRVLEVNISDALYDELFEMVSVENNFDNNIEIINAVCEPCIDLCSEGAKKKIK